MTGSQSKESAISIARLEERVSGLQSQIDRRFDTVDTDLGEMRDDVKWMRRTMIGVIVSLLIASAAVILTGLGS